MQQTLRLQSYLSNHKILVYDIVMLLSAAMCQYTQYIRTTIDKRELSLTFPFSLLLGNWHFRQRNATPSYSMIIHKSLTILTVSMFTLIQNATELENLS